MAQSEEIILEVNLVDDNTAQRIADISNELNSLKESQKALSEETKKSGQVSAEQAKAMTENKARIADINKELNAHVKALQKEQQEQKKNADSLNSMRAQLKEMIKAYDNLSKAERENSEVGGKQVAMINQLTDQIKELEEGTQRYQRNVGNYANSITKALASQVPAIGSVSNAMVGLKTATGWIGIVIQGAVMLFTALSTAFKRTEGNGDKLTGGLAKMKGLFVMLQQALEPLTKIIVDGFVVALDKALQAIGWLGEKLVSFLRAIKADGMADNLEAFAKRTRETAEATSQLAMDEEKLNRNMREANKLQKQYQYEAEKLRQLRDDDRKSIQERIQANEDLKKKLDEQLNAELNLANEAVRIAQENIRLNGKTEEAEDRLAEAEERVWDIRERINSQMSEYLSNQNSLRKEAEAMAKVVDDIYANMSNEDIVYKLLGKPEKVKLDEEDDEEIIDEASRLQEINNLRLQYEQMGFDERLKLQKENLEIERAQRIANGEDAINTEIWYQGELTRIVAENADARKQKMIDAVSVSIESASAFVSALRQVAKASGEEAKYEKLLAGAEIAINTATAISQAVSSAMSVGFPACIPAIITAIGAVVAGMVQATTSLKSANVPNGPKFASGGLVTGEGTATSDSIPAMLSNGESVMTARATSAYSPILSALNTSVGGAPIGESTKTKGTQQLVQQFADAVMNTPIYTAVTDINEGQARVAKIVDNSNY